MAISVNSKGWKNFMAKLYGWGAAIVIVGALFKIQHWKGADLFLILGLGTEAVIFFFSAFEKPHEEVDWSLVYPELAMGNLEEDDSQEKYDSRVQELNSMMEKAKIDADLIEGLGNGLRNFGDAASRLNETIDAAAATKEYGVAIEQASRKIEAMNELFESQLNNRTMQDEASQRLVQNLSASVETSEKLSHEIANLADNLGQLNNVYGNMLSAMNPNRG